ncbi:GNAT family N-acetyltransferase [Nocardia sp. AG03]|uniref:GNAT family N-acetyltransferase n=1 Tax=Nocardia sp. AG03 TaxID=3025312 RepID=UPI0024188547|nr:GNAT family N-acetyltransferase [Nocardia sp. AG03]
MASTVTLRHRWAADLDATTLYELLRLRVLVFVVEQSCAYPELDGRDLLASTRHFWLTDDDAIIGTLRLLEEPTGYRVGRVCLAPSARGLGHTSRLMRAALAETGTATVVLDAQSHLVDMYTRYGFAVDGPEFLDDGIPHTPMRRG